MHKTKSKHTYISYVWPSDESANQNGIPKSKSNSSININKTASKWHLSVTQFDDH